MSRTMIYAIGIVLLWVLCIRPLRGNSSTETKEKTEETREKMGTGLSSNETESGITTDATGQQKYRNGMRRYTS